MRSHAQHTCTKEYIQPELNIHERITSKMILFLAVCKYIFIIKTGTVSVRLNGAKDTSNTSLHNFPKEHQCLLQIFIIEIRMD